MSLPTLVCEMSFTDPADMPVWETLPVQVLGFVTARGRQQELDTIEAGTANAVADDPTRALDPDNAAGPHYGDILPMRRFRIRAILGDESGESGERSFPIFSGFAQSFPRVPAVVGDGAAVMAVDGFKVLNLSGVGGTFLEENTGDRITALLDAAGWPADARSVGVGDSDIQEVLLAQSPALANLQETNEVENGAMFIDADGKLVFRNRHAALAGSSLGTFTNRVENPGELRFETVVSAFDDTLIWNDVQILREGGSAYQVAEDAASIARYFRRTLASQGVLITSDLEARSSAEWLLGKYAEPGLRFTQLTIKPESDESWSPVLDLEIGDRITVIKRGLVGAEIVQECVIERVAHEWNVGATWVTTLALSPAETRSFWILDQSALDVDTRLAY